MTELNIVELIENHPISKLTDTYNVKLLNKIKENFSDAEQQLFIGSFYCYLNYDIKKDFMVDLDNVWKWMGFSQKIRAKELLEKHFIIENDYKLFALDQPKANSDNKHSAFSAEKATSDKPIHGGHNIKKIMMTIRCFKSLCLKAQTKKASEIHEYYIKMEEVLHEVIEEEGTELKKKMQEQKQLLDQKTEELKQTPELERHKLLLHKYGVINGSLVYIVRIETHDNGEYIIKIGQSQKGIKNRFNEFKKKYGNQVLILDCFLVQNSMGFERFIHCHSDVHPNKVTTLKDHEKENELFLIGRNLSYSRLLDIIESNHIQFDYTITDYERLKLENEQLRAKSPQHVDHPSIQEILKTSNILLQKIQKLETSNNDIISRLNTMQTKTTTACSQPDPHVGPRLQKINPETFELVHVYETVTECIKEDNTLKRPSINKAAQENTVYHGFRWKTVDRNIDATIVTIEPTKITKIQKNGYIAKVNKEKTEILTIYINRKTAAKCNDYPCISSLDCVVKNGTLKDNYYYKLFEDCDTTLQNKWKAVKGDPILYHDGIGQYKDGILITEFISRHDCVTKACISQKSLAKVLDKDLKYKDCYFKSLGDKLFV